ncbi:MAG: asparagine synthase (glutamine-hydrolyzing) [Dehalococcoidia bacterium]|nr:asparagine synthase (glutamine-hydrolyzing) [Dehalococcoidia bacterium]
MGLARLCGPAKACLMCGIAGIYDLAGSAVGNDELERMVATIVHRGPDATSTHCFPGGGLGSTRLAVLDLRPESNQPFVSTDGHYAVSYNGEIFNYLELREQLLGLGHSFRTDSDTEVLLEAYREWGADAVGRLNGMWAFAIYDGARDELFCSRDRFGIKPFYYAQDGGRFLFASEVKALLAVAPALAEPDHAHLARFVADTVEAQLTDTFFARIKRLDPAHNMLVTRTASTTTRYWDYPHDLLHDITFEEAAEQIATLLQDAIRLRMRSDVPVGTLLSSGVDSSALVCLLRTVYSGPHQVFTGSYPGEPFDESPAAARLAAELDMEHHAVPGDCDDFAAAMCQVIRYMESPTYSPEVIPRWNIYRQMRGSITVALEGQGADELFGGYVLDNVPYALADAAGRGDLMEFGASALGQLRTWGVRSSLHNARPYLVPPAARRAFRSVRRREPVYHGGPDGTDAGGQPAAAVAAVRGPFSDRVTAALHREHTGRLRSQLHYGDAMSMAHSVESRLPFMDVRLVEFGFRLPGKFKVRRATGKAVLREAVRRHVPARILAPRTKLGFLTPVASWLRERPEEALWPLLHDERARQRGVFDMAAVERAANEHVAGEHDRHRLLFRWLSTELWYRTFIDGAAHGDRAP